MESKSHILTHMHQSVVPVPLHNHLLIAKLLRHVLRSTVDEIHIQGLRRVIIDSSRQPLGARSRTHHSPAACSDVRAPLAKARPCTARQSALPYSHEMQQAERIWHVLVYYAA